MNETPREREFPDAFETLQLQAFLSRFQTHVRAKAECW